MCMYLSIFPGSTGARISLHFSAVELLGTECAPSMLVDNTDFLCKVFKPIFIPISTIVLFFFFFPLHPNSPSQLWILAHQRGGKLCLIVVKRLLMRLILLPAPPHAYCQFFFFFFCLESLLIFFVHFES